MDALGKCQNVIAHAGHHCLMPHQLSLLAGYILKVDHLQQPRQYQEDLHC